MVVIFYQKKIIILGNTRVILRSKNLTTLSVENSAKNVNIVLEIAI